MYLSATFVSVSFVVRNVWQTQRHVISEIPAQQVSRTYKTVLSAKTSRLEQTVGNFVNLSGSLGK